ncbi:YkuD domain-containing protein [Hyphomicrobiales bacterium]|nr:YkuD domain-containing protein [Hyphomicrobiales bacterium]CAH1694167.1 YkuD domain-containing protein [Hyphomicrobiales bacterium]
MFPYTHVLFRKLGAALPVCFLVLAMGAAQALSVDEINNAGRPLPAKAKSHRPIASLVKTQTLLARQGISPGEIDGMDGDNYRKAIAEFRRQRNLGAGDVVDEATWRALQGDTSKDILRDYSVTKEDMKSKFVGRIPHDYARQARMKRLGYQNAREMFAERFKMSEDLLRSLNPKARYRRPGEMLYVISAARKLPSDDARTIEADKAMSLVRALNAAGETIASYPATIGSTDTPSPEGEYQVVRVVRNPSYHYDPVKNFQQGRNKRRLVLAKGPNNPVGTVWIELSKPTFGIHGTPEPSRIGKTSSHGCVRLTNWDAQELAQLVKPGTTVRFID